MEIDEMCRSYREKGEGIDIACVPWTNEKMQLTVVELLFEALNVGY